MASKIINCSHCSKKFEIENKTYNQKIKSGQQNFWCSNDCRIVFKGLKKLETVACRKCQTSFQRNSTLKRLKIHCSVKCANSHAWSEQSKLKNSISIKSLYEKSTNNKVLEKDRLVDRECVVCKGSFFSKKHNHNKYCSSVCRKEAASNNGGYRKGSGVGKNGWYKNTQFDSTYELAFFLFRKDLNLERNTFRISYKSTYYIPDFRNGDIFYEIKGYHTPTVDDKITEAKSRGYEVVLVGADQIKPMIDWVKKEYKVKRLEELYDGYRPKYNYTCFRCGKEFETDKKRLTLNKVCGKFCRK